MRAITVPTFAAIIIAGVISLSPAANAQAPRGGSAAVPDFSGVYYASRDSGIAAGGPNAQPQSDAARTTPQRPTRAPVADLASGRPPDAPSLTPEYLSKWQTIRQSRMTGSYEYDNAARCLPPGMPAMMSGGYGLEIVQTKDRIVIINETNDAVRRIYIDGRTPTAKILDDPTYAGYSTGHWEGDTLVVDTVALNDRSYIDGATASPHSVKLTIK
jgi:hypothetical protein